MMNILNLNAIVLNRKTSYFLIYFYSLLYKFVYGYLSKIKQLCLFVKPVYLLYILTYLKYNTIASFIVYWI